MRRGGWAIGLAAIAFAWAVTSCSSSSGPGTGAGADAGGDAAPTTGTVCLVADTGGLDDRSFNQTAFDGVQQAKTLYGWEGIASETQTAADYAPSIQKFVASGKCNLIVTVGFELSAATAAAADAAPTQRFQILDATIDPVRANVWGQLYATDQASFLAGYVAAGTSKSGVVATFGGMQIPPVTNFMNGFALGVAYFNQHNGTNVQLLGWDVQAQSGKFTGDFVNQQAGGKAAEDYLAQGADVVFPVAGAVGLGAARAILSRGTTAYVIGVDSDWTESAPDYKSVTLTSVVKKLDKSVLTAIDALIKGSFRGGPNTSVLASGEVDIAPFHDLDSVVPAKVKTDLETIRAGIVSGTIHTSP
jgi:basic membrane protein A